MSRYSYLLVTCLVGVFLITSCSKDKLEIPETKSGIVFYTNDGDERILAISNFKDGFVYAGTSGGDAFVFAVDAQGKQLWYTKVGTILEDQFFGVVETSKGNIVACGFTSKESEGGNTDSYVVKFDANGQVMWEQTFGDSAYSDNFYDIREDQNGDFVAVGFYAPSHAVSRIVKMNSDGDFIWDSYINAGPYNSFSRTVEFDDNGNTLVAGFGSPSAVVTEVRKFVPYMIRLESDSGDFLDGYIYSSQTRKKNATGNSLYMSLFKENSGYTLIYGNSRYDNRDVVQVIRLSSDLNISSSTQFEGLGYTQFLGARRAQNGGYLVCGSSSDDQDYNYSKSVVFGVNSFGKEEWSIYTGSENRIQSSQAVRLQGDLYYVAGYVNNANTGSVSGLSYLMDSNGAIQNRE